MVLKLTTSRALQYEEKQGEDIIAVLQNIAATETVTIKVVVGLFEALGEDHTPEKFDEWEAPFTVKAEKIVEACKEYIQGKKK